MTSRVCFVSRRCPSQSRLVVSRREKFRVHKKYFQSSTLSSLAHQRFFFPSTILQNTHLAATFVTTAIMGLAGVKNKSKLSHDPNNTNWSKSTTNFGHKILLAQGWKPGDYLGAENAAQSSHYTAANASHIRVVLREENQGIGVQVGKGNAETFGLSMFSGLLGRLNGKSDEELEKKQNALRDIELGTFHAQRYGSMNFVSGGLLVGDKMEFPKSTVLPVKKRKAEDMADLEEPELKKTKGIADAEAGLSGNVDKEQKKKAEKKERKERKERESRAKEERKLQKAARKAEKSSTKSTDGLEKARLKAEKRARKEERRARKEAKRARKAAKDVTRSKPTTETSASSSESEGTATPPVADTVFGGRHAVRQRYIMQKRRAHMDPQALKEIFMLQAKAAES